MKLRMVFWGTALSALTLVGSGSAQALDIEGPQPTVAGQIGTSAVQRGLDVDGNELITKRVGVIAYCADIAPNAATLGIFGVGDTRPVEDASTIGFFGAQNLVDMIMWDDGIPRFRDVALIDGDRDMPTAQELIDNFDCVVAYTDNQCGVRIPEEIAESAAKALSKFAEQPGRGVVLTGFAFNESIGFGNKIFRRNLSPITKSSPAVDPRCTPPDPNNPSRSACPIGVCPEGSERQFPPTVTAPQCFSCPAGCENVPDENHPTLDLALCIDSQTGSFCGQFRNPVFTPVTATSDFVCESLFEGVNGPTSSSFANELDGTSVAPGATLCGNYDAQASDLPLLAVNEDRNVVALNLFPAYADDLRKTWFSCVVANAAIYACGEDRCRPADVDAQEEPFCENGRLRCTGNSCGCCQ